MNRVGPQSKITMSPGTAVEINSCSIKAVGKCDAFGVVLRYFCIQVHELDLVSVQEIWQWNKHIIINKYIIQNISNKANTQQGHGINVDGVGSPGFAPCKSNKNNTLLSHWNCRHCEIEHLGDGVSVEIPLNDIPSTKLILAPENGPSQKETIVFQPSIFRGKLAVRFREGNLKQNCSSSPAKLLQTFCSCQWCNISS